MATKAMDEYLSKMKRDPFYRLTVNVEDADSDESDEILSELDSLSDDDLTISSKKDFWSIM